MSKRYERPELFILGGFRELTQQQPGGPIPNGNDPCSLRGPHGLKQTGLADYIQGNAALQTCSLAHTS
jgi:hypothetical protein